MWTEIKMKKVAGILVIGAALALGMVQSGHAEWTWRDSAIMGEVEAEDEGWRKPGDWRLPVSLTLVR